jgi:hypothetical protein
MARSKKRTVKYTPLNKFIAMIQLTTKQMEAAADHQDTTVDKMWFVKDLRKRLQAVARRLGLTDKPRPYKLKLASVPSTHGLAKVVANQYYEQYQDQRHKLIFFAVPTVSSVIAKGDIPEVTSDANSTGYSTYEFRKYRLTGTCHTYFFGFHGSNRSVSIPAHKVAFSPMDIGSVVVLDNEDILGMTTQFTKPGVRDLLGIMPTEDGMLASFILQGYHSFRRRTRWITNYRKALPVGLAASVSKHKTVAELAAGENMANIKKAAAKLEKTDVYNELTEQRNKLAQESFANLQAAVPRVRRQQVIAKRTAKRAAQSHALESDSESVASEAPSEPIVLPPAAPKAAAPKAKATTASKPPTKRELRVRELMQTLGIGRIEVERNMRAGLMK